MLHRPSNNKPVIVKQPTPLIAAIVGWYTELVDYLTQFEIAIEAECFVDDVTNNPRAYSEVTAVHLAALAGKLRMVTQLLKHGSHVNKPNTLGDTPLFEACFEGHLSVVKYLIEQGADIDITNNKGTNALMIACYADNSEIIKYLVEQKADLTMSDNEGRNVMFYTVAGGR